MKFLKRWGMSICGLLSGIITGQLVPSWQGFVLMLIVMFLTITGMHLEHHDDWYGKQK